MTFVGDETNVEITTNQIEPVRFILIVNHIVSSDMNDNLDFLDLINCSIMINFLVKYSKLKMTVHLDIQ